MATTTFTLRIKPRDHELLTLLAEARKQTVADLARELLSDGIRRLLDPEEIDRTIEQERKRLMDIAETLRAQQEADTS